MQFVWPLWIPGACGDEIRFSIKSIEKNFQGEVKITIIGDKPDWYTGHYISKPHINDNEALCNFRDVLSKIDVLSKHPEVDSRFVIMYDDIYLLNPCTEEELWLPRIEPPAPYDPVLSRVKWERLKTQTFQHLADSGFSQDNYATHLPQPIVKSELQQVFSLPIFADREYLRGKVYLWEVIYGNMFRTAPILSKPFLARVLEPVTKQIATAAKQSSVFLNHHNRKGWCGEFRSWLVDEFGD